MNAWRLSNRKQPFGKGGSRQGPKGLIWWTKAERVAAMSSTRTMRMALIVAAACFCLLGTQQNGAVTAQLIGSPCANDAACLVDGVVCVQNACAFLGAVGDACEADIQCAGRLECESDECTDPDNLDGKRRVWSAISWFVIVLSVGALVFMSQRGTRLLADEGIGALYLPAEKKAMRDAAQATKAAKEAEAAGVTASKPAVVTEDDNKNGDSSSFMATNTPGAFDASGVPVFTGAESSPAVADVPAEDDHGPFSPTVLQDLEEVPSFA